MTDNIYDEDSINFDDENLYKCCGAIIDLNAEFSAFASQLNATSITCAELSTKGLLDDSKTIIKTCETTINELTTNVNNTKNAYIQMFPEAELLFALIDEGKITADGEISAELTDNEKVEILKQFLTIYGGAYPFYLFGNVNQNSSVVLYNYGAGANDGMYDKFMSNITNFYSEDKSNFKNGVFIPFNPYSNNRLSVMKELINQLNEKYSGVAKNVTTVGFSDGGQHAMKQMAELLREYPEIESPVIVLADAYNSKAYNNEDLKLLGEKNAVVFAIHQENFTAKDAAYEKWAQDYGINVIKIEDNYCKMNYLIKDDFSGNLHQRAEKDYFDFDIPSFQTNQGTFPSGTFTSYTGEVKDYYTAQLYDSNTGSWKSYAIGGKTITQVYNDLGLQYNGLTANGSASNPLVDLTLNGSLATDTTLEVNMTLNNTSLDKLTEIPVISETDNLQQNNNINLDLNGNDELISLMDSSNTETMNPDLTVNNKTDVDIYDLTTESIRNEEISINRNNVLLDNNVTVDYSNKQEIMSTGLSSDNKKILNDTLQSSNVDNNNTTYGYTSNTTTSRPSVNLSSSNVKIASSISSESTNTLVVPESSVEDVEVHINENAISTVNNNSSNVSVNSTGGSRDMLYYNNVTDNSTIENSKSFGNTISNVVEESVGYDSAVNNNGTIINSAVEYENNEISTSMNTNTVSNDIPHQDNKTLKFIVPGIIGAGIGVASVGVGKVIKNNKKDEDM